MAETLIAGVQVPVDYAQHIRELTTDLSALWESGIVKPEPRVQAEAASPGGATINMPFWNDLTGDDQVLGDGVTITTTAITSGNDIAQKIGRAGAWASTDFAAEFAGSDPLEGIAVSIARWWARRHQDTMLSILEGLFGSGGTLVSTNLLDITGEGGTDAVVSAKAILNAAQKLGDAKDKLTGIMMDSAVENVLRQNNLISDFAAESTLGAPVKTYLGKRVIVDDKCPSDSGTHSVYLFGEGAFAYADAMTKKPFESDRDVPKSIDAYYSRKNFYLHPRGCAWQGAVMAGDTPTNAELADVTNWSKVYDQKHIRIVRLDCLIAAA